MQAVVLWFDEAGRDDARISQDKREYTHYFKAQVVGDEGVYKALLIARPDLAPFQRHPDDLQALVQTFNPQRIENSDGIYDITVDYSTAFVENDGDNPLAEPCEIEVESAERKRVKIRDADGKLCLNTAGDLLDDPPPEVEEADLVFVCKKNVSIRLPRWITQYRNAINSDVVVVRSLPYPPGQLKIKKLRIGKEDVRNKIPFTVLSFELHQRDEGWTDLIPNRGYYELIPKNQVTLPSGQEAIVVSSLNQKVEYERRPILIDGEPCKEPQMLDKKGRRIAKPTVDNIVLLEFNFQRKLPFSVLPLK